jgi:hypothetical protein
VERARARIPSLTHDRPFEIIRAAGHGSGALTREAS